MGNSYINYNYPFHTIFLPSGHSLLGFITRFRVLNLRNLRTMKLWQLSAVSSSTTAQPDQPRVSKLSGFGAIPELRSSLSFKAPGCRKPAGVWRPAELAIWEAESALYGRGKARAGGTRAYDRLDSGYVYIRLFIERHTAGSSILSE